MATINEELTKLESTKADIKSALVEKGLNPTDEFSSYALNIRDILSGGGGDLDFSKIGYSYTPLFITDGLKYGEQLYNMDLSSISDWSSWLISDNLKKNIVFMPKLDLTNSPLYTAELSLILYTNLEIFPDMKFGDIVLGSQCFKNCNSIKSIRINADSVKLNTEYLITSLNNKGSLKEIEIKAPFDVTDADMYYFLYNCENLEKVDINFTGAIKAAGDLFGHIGSELKRCTITKLPDCSNLTSLDYMLQYSWIAEMGDWNISKITNLNSFSNLSAFKIKSVDVASLKGLSNKGYLLNAVYYMVIKNLGKAPSAVTWNLSWAFWGVEDASIPLSAGARQSVIDSLITYSFDRATEYKVTNTVSLSTNTFNLLTAEEIAQITAKGYTLTTK